MMIELQAFLVDAFKSWLPPEPEVLKKTKFSITLSWHRVEPFHFIADQLLYRLEKNEKIPSWVVVYRGGKTSKEIDNLASRHCHKFRLRVIVKATAVPTLAERAVHFYGDEAAVYEHVREVHKQREDESFNGNSNNKDDKGGGDASALHSLPIDTASNLKSEEIEDGQNEIKETRLVQVRNDNHKWLESQWSEPTWSSTDTDGTSAVCFCMAVRCGYIKQVQGMLDERPALIGIINPKNGFTPLATAVRKGIDRSQTVTTQFRRRRSGGPARPSISDELHQVTGTGAETLMEHNILCMGDINTVRFLLTAGAEIDQASSTGQTALQIAVLGACVPIVQLLLEQGADFQGRDLNGLRVEHYAVDSCSLEMLRYILDKGGDVHAEDDHGWTPLFRALCQGAATDVIEELVVRGSSLEMADRAGLPLTSVARLLNRQGRSRDSVLRLVDSSYPHEKALANFTRLTKKIYNVHSLLKLPSPRNKKN